MITTSHVYETAGCKGQDCINAAFMSLHRYIDNYKDQLNNQKYSILEYTGEISSNTVLHCSPPTYEQSVYGSNGDGKLYCVGRIYTNGQVCFTDTSKMKVSCICNYSFNKSSTTTWCAYQNYSNFPTSAPYVNCTDCCNISCVTYKAYTSDAQIAAGLDNQPIYDCNCVCTQVLCAGDYQCGDVYVTRSITCQLVDELYYTLPCNYSVQGGIFCKTRGQVSYPLYTTSYCCVCKWTDMNGCTVCTPLQETANDCVVAVIPGCSGMPNMYACFSSSICSSYYCCCEFCGGYYSWSGITDENGIKNTFSCKSIVNPNSLMLYNSCPYNYTYYKCCCNTYQEPLSPEEYDCAIGQISACNAWLGKGAGMYPACYIKNICACNYICFPAFVYTCFWCNKNYLSVRDTVLLGGVNATCRETCIYRICECCSEYRDYSACCWNIYMEYV